MHDGKGEGRGQEEEKEEEQEGKQVLGIEGPHHAGSIPVIRGHAGQGNGQVAGAQRLPVRQPSRCSNGQTSHLGIGWQERQCRTGRCRPSTGWQDGNWGMLPKLRSNLFGSDTIDHSKINE